MYIYIYYIYKTYEPLVDISSKQMIEIPIATTDFLCIFVFAVLQVKI